MGIKRLQARERTDKDFMGDAFRNSCNDLLLYAFQLLSPNDNKFLTVRARRSSAEGTPSSLLPS